VEIKLFAYAIGLVRSGLSDSSIRKLLLDGGIEQEEIAEFEVHLDLIIASFYRTPKY